MQSISNRFAWRGVVLGLMLYLPAAAHAQSGYTITDLGAGYANGINNNGQVVGSFPNETIPPTHAYLYSNGQKIGLGNIMTTNRPDLDDVQAFGINDNGQIVGQYSYTGQDPSGLRHGDGGGFLYQNGQMQALGRFGDAPVGGLAISYAINNAGIIVGEDIYGKAAIYQNGVTTVLNTQSNYSEARAINNSGEIAGNDGAHAFSYQNGVEQILPPIYNVQGEGSVAYGLNDSGVVVGSSGASDNYGHATYWQNGVPHDIGPSGIPTVARGINNSGVIVGEVIQPNNEFGAFVYENGQMTDLLAGTGWHNGYATSINDSGQIVGFAFTPRGSLDGFLLTPRAVPAPGSLLTFGVGTGVLLFAARRRKRASSSPV